MLLLKTMGMASLSRVNGGLIYDHLRAPIRQEKLENHIKNIRNGEGLTRYYHLDETTGMLTRFEKKKDYDYFPSNSKQLTVKEIRQMSLAYETLYGYNPEDRRFRTPFLSDNLMTFR